MQEWLYNTALLPTTGWSYVPAVVPPPVLAHTVAARRGRVPPLCALT